MDTASKAVRSWNTLANHSEIGEYLSQITTKNLLGYNQEGWWAEHFKSTAQQVRNKSLLLFVQRLKHLCWNEGKVK
jgi:hypothetical protein